MHENEIENTGISQNTSQMEKKIWRNCIAIIAWLVWALEKTLTSFLCLSLPSPLKYEHQQHR